MEGIARAAGVGEPARYRRFADKVALVAHAISTQLPAFEVPDLGDTREELRLSLQRGATRGRAVVRAADRRADR